MSTAVAQKPHLRLVPAPAPAPEPSRPSSPAFDDSELLRAVREGDRGSAAALHDRVRPQVDRTVRRLLGAGDPDHEDLVQMTLIEIVSSIDRFRGDCSLDGWTSTVAAHIVYKHIRRRRTERRLFGYAAADDVTAVAPVSMGRTALARNLLARVVDTIRQVDESKAWTYVLHDVCGYDLKEIAQITGVSVAAAQTRLVRGRREVHERIAADPELAKRLEDMGETT
ncbi:MAG: sigma-70 family RNA polymerase sigma factor [Myxococcales bacterium]|nr:sigma-70 family RNA polymerase sigma factor [Myxococcales bacterium]